MDGQMMKCVQFEIVFVDLNTQSRIIKARTLTHSIPDLSSGQQRMIVADRLENRAILGRAICCVKREPSAAALSNIADPRSKTREQGGRTELRFPVDMMLCLAKMTVLGA
jgi:hypothetical protein